MNEFRDEALDVKTRLEFGKFPQIDIQPSEEASIEKADAIYNSIMMTAFSADNKANENIGENKLDKKTLEAISWENAVDEIYNSYEGNYIFEEFDFKDERLEKILSYFDSANWERLDEKDKENVTKVFGNYLACNLDLKHPPKMTFWNGEQNNCGLYDNRINTIKLNCNILGNPKDVVDTAAHETWHAYQRERAKCLETRKDALYAFNFENYILPQKIDGKYVNFDMYESQLVEVEARAFAKILAEKVGDK